MYTDSYIIFAFTLACLLLPILSSDAGASDASYIHRFSEIYEPSGAIFMAAGDLLVVEDDGDFPLHFFPFKDGANGFENLQSPPVDRALSTPVSDLEGAALGRDETVYLITSFSTSKNNKRKQKRQRLIQFKIEDGRVIQERHYDHLLSSLSQQLLKEKHLDSTDADTLNIEGIAFDQKKKHLLIGLRTPLADSRAIIVILENPYDLFANNSEPHFSEKNIGLNLGGRGIRGITYDQTLKTYLIVNEVLSKKGKLRPALWSWDGNKLHKPVKISLPKLKGVKNFEGVATIKHNSNHFLLLVCDDGKRKKGKGGHYVVLDFKQLP